ncbi:ABC transporter [Delftia sp. HK171]|uniref:ABC transporter ATP-binding protein n=1 Tax=Delftia acidovorans TaxID=80866 RepID=A0AAJ2VFA5_DELAC|nr:MULTISPECIES: ABC transporter ATP-binding protein [Delftia]APE47915.1 ABC transporter [Delftia sp. HK171]MDX4956712.1 ABC transporter ATP-binding protein [Delftia acidovorans]
MESSIESARPPARPQATVAAWAQSVEQAIASQQWHGAWRALIDAALPAETAVQQSLLTALDAWDGLAADSGAEPRRALVQQAFDALHAAHAPGQALQADSAPPRAHRVQGRQLVKRYRRGGFALGPVDVAVEPGTILGLVGENGNGKTTLLRLLAADLAPDAGQLDWGVPATDAYLLRTQLAYIPQRPAVWGGRLMDHLQFAARSHGAVGPRNICLVQLVIAQLGLRAFRGHQWKQLSSGYKMRFELARALLCRPRVLLLDEPLANLDINAQQTLLTDLQSLVRSPWQPMALVLSSQQLYEVEKVADQVLFLEQGQPRSVQQSFAAMEGCAIEFETGWAMAQLKPWLDRLPSHTHQLSGQTHIVSFHVPFTAAQFLAQAVQAQMPVRYFRDITASTRRLFVRD